MALALIVFSALVGCQSATNGVTAEPVNNPSPLASSPAASPVNNPTSTISADEFIEVGSATAADDARAVENDGEAAADEASTTTCGLTVISISASAVGDPCMTQEIVNANARAHH